MPRLVRFGVSLEDALLKRFDRLISGKGYKNRSQALRDLIRESIVQEDWEVGQGEVVGALSLVYNHHQRQLMEKLTELQHHGHQKIISTLHVHLDEENCLEVIILRGKGKEIKALADNLIATRGVRHGKLTVATARRAV